MPTPLVTLCDVHVVLAGTPALSGVSLEVRAGEGLAIVGDNGSGKSTLLRLLRGDVWPDPRGHGRRLFHGPDGASPSHIGVRERLALVAPEAQDAYLRRDWDLPVEVVVRSGFFDALWPSEAATAAQSAKVAEVAAELGISHLLGRSMLELSRGEGRRVLLARALVSRPAALLLDEACDGLDARARSAFLELVSAAARRGTTVVMATHRPEEIVPEIGRVVRLAGGRILWSGSRAEFVGLPPSPPPPRADPTPQHDRHLVSSLPLSSEAREGAGGWGRWRGGGAAEVVFDLVEATVLREGRPVLADLQWTVRSGERWSIVGGNGAGKSTLLRLLAGEEQPARGRVERMGLGPRAGADDLRGRVGMVSPELQARHRFEATGEEVVLSGFAGTVGLAVAPTPAQRARAAAAADRLGTRSLLDRNALALSYGELRKLLFARALAPGPEALLLDEPLAGLDSGARASILSALEDLGPRGPALIAVSHHADELPRGGHRLRLEGGRLLRGE